MLLCVRFLTIFLWLCTAEALVASKPELPPTLVWLLLDNSADGTTVFENNPVWGKEFGKLSLQWGVPLVMPLLDLEELSQITVQDLTSGNIPVLKQAAERYGADVNLIGRLQQTSPDAWTAHWQLLLDNDKVAWKQTATNEQALLADGIQALALQLQKRYTVTTTPSEGVILIEITQVTTEQEYSKLLQYLKKLPWIVSVRVQSVQGSQIILQITPKGSMSSLEQALALDGHLVKLQGTQYRWSGL